MGRKTKYFKEIDKLMDIGYDAKTIVKITNIPHATVYRTVDKLRAEAKLDFKELMENDYLYKYQENLKNLSKTIVQCNERMVEVDKKYDELEETTQGLLDAVEDNKHVSKSNFITNLITIRSNHTNEIAKLIAQRDRATSEKANLYNKGPVVYRINEFVQNKIANVPQMLSTGITVTEAPVETPVAEISDEDQEILDEMERYEG